MLITFHEGKVYQTVHHVRPHSENQSQEVHKIMIKKSFTGKCHVQTVDETVWIIPPSRKSRQFISDKVHLSNEPILAQFIIPLLSDCGAVLFSFSLGVLFVMCSCLSALCSTQECV